MVVSPYMSARHGSVVSKIPGNWQWGGGNDGMIDW